MNRADWLPVCTPLSPSAEARLFAAADELLARRRALIAERALPRGRIVILPRRLSIAALAAAALAAIMLWSWRGGDAPVQTFTEVTPEIKKDNDAPTLYDQERLAEERAYEKEAEDAQDIYDGGT